MPLTAGIKLGPYEIQAPLGAGGKGEIYRARDPRLQRDVAIKVLPAFISRDPDRLRRFEQEARATGALNHPNIVAVFDVGTYEGLPYLVTELLEGSSLRARMAGPIPSRKATDYGVQIAHGLAAASRQRNRSSRPETGKHLHLRGRQGQNSGFRPCQADRARTAGCDRHESRRNRPHGLRRCPRYRWLYVAQASPRRESGLTVRH